MSYDLIALFTMLIYTYLHTYMHVCMYAMLLSGNLIVLKVYI